MFRKIISTFVIVLMLVCSLNCRFSIVKAEGPEPTIEELEEAAKIVTESIDGLKDIMDDPSKASSFKSAFTNISKLAEGIGNIADMASSCVSFLQMIGVIEDPVEAALSEITTELGRMDGKLNAIDSKLVDIMKAMSTIQALSEFNARTSTAMQLNDRWSTNLQNDLVINGIDKSVTLYESKVSAAVQNWCKNPATRNNTDLSVDNSCLYLRYAILDNASHIYDLICSKSNGAPTDESMRYLYLSADFLPGKIDYTEESYRQDIIDAIVSKIKAYVNSENYEGFECRNFPEFTKEGKASLTDDLINSVASDAVDTIVFRTTYCQLNKDGEESANFAKGVKTAYENYCNELLTSGHGIDALLNTVYLTNAFEGDVKKDIGHICDQTIVKAAMYGNFAIQVTGNSIYINNEDKNSIVKTYTDTIDALQKIKKNSLTGQDNYSYITNTKFAYTEVSFIITAKMKQKKDGDNRAYEGSSSSDFAVKFYHGSKGDLIGDVDMQVLLYTLSSLKNAKPSQADGARFKAEDGDVLIDDNFIDKYFVKYIDSGHDYPMDKIVTSYSAQQELSTSATVLMKANNQMGNKPGQYFDDDPTFYLGSLPSPATTNFLSDLKTINGTTFSVSSQSLDNNDYLGSFGIYGESHTLWYVDEAAFLGGPFDNFVTNGFLSDVQERKTGDIYYDEDLTQTTIFRCLQKEALPSLRGQDSLYNPLQNYRNLTMTIAKDYLVNHDFERTIAKEPTCLEEGLYKYTCVHTDEQGKQSTWSHYETIPVIEHKFSEGVTTVDPTCEEKGIITYTCSVDPNRSHIETKGIDPLGHIWGGWSTIKEASCSAYGLERRLCSRCGSYETRTIAKKDDCSFIRPSYTVPMTGIGQ